MPITCTTHLCTHTLRLLVGVDREEQGHCKPSWVKMRDFCLGCVLLQEKLPCGGLGVFTVTGLYKLLCPFHLIRSPHLLCEVLQAPLISFQTLMWRSCWGVPRTPHLLTQQSPAHWSNQLICPSLISSYIILNRIEVEWSKAIDRGNDSESKKWDEETIRGNENDTLDDARSTTYSICCHLRVPRAQIAAVSIEKCLKDNIKICVTD